MARGDHVGAHLPGYVQEGVEFYLAVAEHVGIGRAALGILVEHIVHHPLTVRPGKVHEIKGYLQLPRDHLRHELLLFPVAVAVERAGGVVPVLHVHREHVQALPLEEEGGNRGVDSSRKAYADFHGTNLVKIEK